MTMDNHTQEDWQAEPYVECERCELRSLISYAKQCWTHEPDKTWTCFECSFTLAVEALWKEALSSCTTLYHNYEIDVPRLRLFADRVKYLARKRD